MGFRSFGFRVPCFVFWVLGLLMWLFVIWIKYNQGLGIVWEKALNSNIYEVNPLFRMLEIAEGLIYLYHL